MAKYVHHDAITTIKAFPRIVYMINMFMLTSLLKHSVTILHVKGRWFLPVATYSGAAYPSVPMILVVT